MRKLGGIWYDFETMTDEQADKWNKLFKDHAGILGRQPGLSKASLFIKCTLEVKQPGRSKHAQQT